MSVMQVLGPATADGGNETGAAFWLDTEPDPIFCVLHTPELAKQTRLAVLILPPFGWDNDCSYRARRDWATALARSGISTLRVDLPGTENSVGSALAPSRLKSWTDATISAARWLRHHSECDRLVVFGIGLGGLIAYQAIVDGAPIDDIALWGVRASGRAFVRELRAYSAVVAGEYESGDSEDDNDGVLAIGGHPMSSATAADLSKLDLTKAQLPQAEQRRVLLIGRDALGVDEKLRSQLVDSGADVTVLEADDYQSLMAPPEYGMRPIKTISASMQWMLAGLSASHAPVHHLEEAPDLPAVLDSIQFQQDGLEIRERLSEIETRDGYVVGIISEPVVETRRAPLCLVVVNTSALRHTGPNRIFVEIARRAAASGVPAARFDLPGLGDSDGVQSKMFERGQEDDAASLAGLQMICDHLEGLGVAERFVTTGLCLGGNLAVRAAVQDDRVMGVLGINVPALTFTDIPRSIALRGAVLYGGFKVVAPERAHDRLPAGVRRIANRLAHLRHVVEAHGREELAKVDWLWRLEHRADVSEVVRGLDELDQTGARVVLMLGENELLRRLLVQSKLARRLERSPNVELELLPTRDHLARQLWIQERLFARISLALDHFGSTTKEDPSHVS